MELQPEYTQPSTTLPQPSAALPLQKTLLQMQGGPLFSQSLYAVAKLGIADLVKR